MDWTHQESGRPRGGQGGAEAGLLALALWLGRQRDDLSAALSALRQAGGLRWASAAGDAYRTALEERRRGLLRAGDSLEAARAVLAFQSSRAAAVRGVGGAGVSAQQAAGHQAGDAGRMPHYEGR